jgi:tetratricopeptide (TPR) repeat protein
MRDLVPALLAVALAISISATASAQDTDRLRVSEGGALAEYSGTINALTVSKVTATIQVADERPKRRDFDGDAVLEVFLSSERKSEAFQEAEQAFNLGSLGEAVDLFARAVKDAGRDDVQKQVAYFQWGSTAYQARQWAKSIEIFQSFVKEMSDTWYMERVYRLMYDAAMANRDSSTANRVIDEFTAAGRSKNKAAWSKMAELLRADMLENQNKIEDAARIYAKYSRDTGSVGEDGAAGELRCLAKQQKWAEAKARAEGIIRDGRQKRGDRVLIAAYNALGDAARQSKETKEALLNFLRGITELESPSVVGSFEHATSLAMSAVTMAEYGSTLPGEKKEQYLDRARNLYGELRSRYPSYDSDGRIQRELNKHR